MPYPFYFANDYKERITDDRYNNRNYINRYCGVGYGVSINQGLWRITMTETDKIEWMYRQLKYIERNRSKWIKKSTLKLMLKIIDDLRGNWSCIYFTSEWDCLREEVV